MELLTEELKKQIPAIYSQEKKKDPTVICKFFDPTSSWRWYVLEGEEAESEDGGDFLFFGYIFGFEAELGYFTLNQLLRAKDGLTGLEALPIERDLYFTPCKLSEVKEQHAWRNGVRRT